MLRPRDVLKQSLNQRVLVTLRGDLEYRGTLEGFDPTHLNLVMASAEEVVAGESRRRLSKVVLRGDNVIYISP